MKKSTCYRLIRNSSTGATEYVLADSYLEIMKDPNGNEFRIHFHKVIEGKDLVTWSATEESTGLKCITYNRFSRKEAYEAMLKIIPEMKQIMSRYVSYVDKLREYKEKNNIK